MHTDHNGDKHEHRYHCPVGHDIDQALLDWVPKLESSLIEGEKESYQSAVEEGADPRSKDPEYGKTPVDLAEACGYKELAKLLRSWD